MIFLVIGAAAGVLAGLFGIGGGVLIVPALLMAARMSPQRATGTSLAALLLPVGALGAWQYWKGGNVDVRAALLIAAGLFAGAWVGAMLAVRLPARELQRVFALFMVVVAVHLWWSAR
jgi:uncharacterized membrane protein YfcA